MLEHWLEGLIAWTFKDNGTLVTAGTSTVHTLSTNRSVTSHFHELVAPQRARFPVGIGRDCGLLRTVGQAAADRPTRKSTTCKRFRFAHFSA